MAVIGLIILGNILIDHQLNPDNYDSLLKLPPIKEIPDVAAKIDPIVITPHLTTPEIVKGIYLTAYTAGNDHGQELINSIMTSEINSVVIDTKNHDGTLAWTPENKELLPYYNPDNIPIPDLPTLMTQLYNAKIYRIARIPVFFDPNYAQLHPEYTVKNATGKSWTDYRGHPWLEVGAQPVWDYNLAIAHEAYRAGFDEIQFDYIRFPSDGDIRKNEYQYFDEATQTKAEALEEFFKYLHTNLEQDNIPHSADVFGLTYYNLEFDLNIGQQLKYILPYFDYVSPMVYPSHYPKNFIGYDNPAEYPYPIIYNSLLPAKSVYEDLGLEFNTRPWLQDFDIGAEYGVTEFKAQTKAVYDVGGSGWILWNARNVYTEWAWEKNLDNLDN